MKTLYLERSCGGGRDGSWTESLGLDGVERIVVGTGPGSFAGIRAALAFAQGYALGRPCEVLGLPSPCAVAAQFYLSNRVRPYQISKSSLAVVGDARRGKLWIALFNGYSLICDIFQVNFEDILGTGPSGGVGTDPSGGVGTGPVSGVGTGPSVGVGTGPAEGGDRPRRGVPEGWPVVTVDEARIGEKLKAAFGERYLGGQTPTAEGLRAFAEANPDALVREPRPIYLNPAVRD